MRGLVCKREPGRLRPAALAYREDSGGFGVYFSQDSRGHFLGSLGFQAPTEIDELAGDQFFAQLRGEQLRLLDRDVLAMIDLAEIAASREELLGDDVEAEFTQAREEHPEFAGASLVLGYGGAGGYGAYASEDTRVRFFQDLGFESPDAVDELAGDGFFVDFDEEQLQLLDQDAVVMFGPRDEIVDHPVFGRLDAAGEERVVYLDLEDQFAGALGFSSPLSLPYLLDEAVPKLAAAVDGDPETTEPEPR